MIGLCDNCALKYADCKGNKDKEKCRCDYYKKPVVMNVKELAERVAELEIENERLRRITEAPTADVVEVVYCKDCKHYDELVCPLNTLEKDIGTGFCNRGERRE